MWTKLIGRTIAVLCMLFLMLPGSSEACNLSLITLDSTVANGSNLDYYITLNIGAGITGTQKGADSDTRTYAFNFYGSPTLSNLGFQPASVTADTTGITAVGVDVGSFMGSRFSIGYIDPGQVTPFVCVTNTSTCGNEHTQSNQYRFTVTEQVDSIRVVGIEGSGNPVAGCYPDADMLINNSTLDVEWRYFEASVLENQVELRWGTDDEEDGFYQVLRGMNSTELEAIARMEMGNGQTDYFAVDNDLSSGTYFYQIRHTTPNGLRTHSEMISVKIDDGKEEFMVTPTLVLDRTKVTFWGGESGIQTLKVFNHSGQELLRRELRAGAGMNEIELDLSGMAPGVYLVELKDGLRSSVQRIVRM
jgi:hypothetical protein